MYKNVCDGDSQLLNQYMTGGLNAKISKFFSLILHKNVYPYVGVPGDDDDGFDVDDIMTTMLMILMMLMMLMQSERSKVAQEIGFADWDHVPRQG